MKITRIGWILLFALIARLAAGFALAADAPKPVEPKPTEPQASATSAPASTLSGQDPASLFQVDDYKLRATDVINVNVAEDASATKDYRISVKGTVTLVYLTDHALKVADLTKEEAANVIRQAYINAKVYKQPSITVDVREFSIRTVNVLGAVAKPGQVPIPAQRELTLVTAITAAGGPTSVADTEVTITRVLPDGKTQRLEHVDLKGAVLDASKDLPIKEGDTIFLGESMFGAGWKKP